MRVLPSAGAAALAVAASVLLAPAAFADAPGDNGTVKIHDAKTGEELVRNEPHVCSFYLDAFKFDGLQEADWKIVEMPPTGTKDKLATSGAITLDDQGHGRTEDMTLPDGHYKLLWNFDGEHGAAKQKVFWTDCADTGATTGATTGGMPTTPASTSGGTTSAGSSAGTSGGPVPSGSPSPTVAAVASAGGTSGAEEDSPSGSLASTGASVLGITGAAALLLAVGAAVRFRRRSGQN